MNSPLMIFAKRFVLDVWQNTFLTEHLRMVASWDYLWILRSLSEHLFMEHLRKTVYFMYKVQDFSLHIQ